MRRTPIHLTKPVVIGLLLIGVVLLIVIVLPWALEPRYQGRSLNDWIESRRVNHSERVAALRARKAQAVPLLIQRLSFEPSPLQRLVRERFPKVAERFRLSTDESIEQVRISAARLLGELGSDALPAVPHLENIWKSEYQSWSTDECRWHARAALVKIRGESVESFMEPLNGNADEETWQDHGLVLAFLGTNAAAAVPRLVETLRTNRNERVRNDIVIALSGIHSQPALCIEPLMECAASSDWRLRESAISALGRFGRDAKPAWSNLVELLHHSERMTAYRASVSLWQIDPEAAKKLGINFEKQAHPRP